MCYSNLLMCLNESKAVAEIGTRDVRVICVQWRRLLRVACGTYLPLGIRGVSSVCVVRCCGITDNIALSVRVVWCIRQRKQKSYCIGVLIVTQKTNTINKTGLQ